MHRPESSIASTGDPNLRGAPVERCVDDREIERRVDDPERAAPRSEPTLLGLVSARSDARDALTRMGYKQHVARDAIDAAIAELGELRLEQLVFQALRRCPRPGA